MKKIYLIVSLLIGNIAFAQDVNYSKKLISKIENAKQNSISERTVIGSIRKAPERICITPYLAEARTHWHLLTQDAKNYFINLGLKPSATRSARPTIPNEVIFQSTFFDFHYTLDNTNGDAVDTADLNTNSTPDYIDFMAQVADSVFTIDSLRGYNMPPADGAGGGTDRYDIYVYKLTPGIYGYVSPQDSIGDNPKSSQLAENNSYTSIMAMRNDYTGFGVPVVAIRVTLAHELCHSIDFGYTVSAGQFFMEAKGAYEEQVIYPDLTDNFQYLSHPLSEPDVALNWSGEDGPSYDGRWYGGWLFLKNIAQKHGDTAAIKFIEKAIYNVNDYQILGQMDSVLRSDFGSDLITAIRRTYVANSVLDPSAIFVPYEYPNGVGYRDYRDNTLGGLFYDANLTFSGTTLNWNSNTDGNARLQRIGVDYLKINTTTAINISVTSSDTSSNTIPVLIKKSTGGPTFEVQWGVRDTSGNYKISMPSLSTYDDFTLAVIRTDIWNTDTNSLEYNINISSMDTTSTCIGLSTFTITPSTFTVGDSIQIALTNPDTLNYTYIWYWDTMNVGAQPISFNINTDNDWLGTHSLSVVSIRNSDNCKDSSTVVTTGNPGSGSTCNLSGISMSFPDSAIAGSNVAVSVNMMPNGYLFTWSTGDTSTINQGINFMIGSTDTVISVTVLDLSDTSCHDLKTVTIRSYTPPANCIGISGFTITPSTFTVGDSVLIALSNFNSNFTYSWFFDGQFITSGNMNSYVNTDNDWLGNHSLELFATDTALGCTDSTTVNTFGNPGSTCMLNTIGINFPDSATTGTSVNISANLMPNGYFFSWSTGDTSYTNNGITFMMGDRDTVINLTITDLSDSTCQASKVFTIRNRPILPAGCNGASSFAVNPSSVTVGESINLSINVFNTSDYSYLWYVNGLSFGNNLAAFTYQTSAGDDGTYTYAVVAVRISDNCKDSSVVAVAVNPAICSVNAGMDQTLIMGESATLGATSTISNLDSISTWTWLEGATTIGTTDTVSFFPSTLGLFSYVVTINTALGCTASDTVDFNIISGLIKSLGILEKSNIYPNPFTNSASIDYSLNSAGLVKIEVYHNNGNKVAILANEIQSKGTHQINLDSKVYGLSSGEYLVKIISSEKTQVLRVVKQ